MYETNEQATDQIKVKGCFRLHIVDPDGTIRGDSGWNTNLVTNEGFKQYLVMALGSISGSKYLGYAALGTGAGPSAADTALGSEVGTRQALTMATTTGSKTLDCRATFASGWHTSSGAYNISSVGLVNSSSGGTLFAGTTYASSSCASNQAVNLTYQIIFS